LRALSDVIGCVRFYSRLPLGPWAFERDPHGMPDFERVPLALAPASLLIAAPGAMALIAGSALGLASASTATLALAVSAFATGAFHEDGLADVADGLGGATRERRLEIMKDSRVGTFGASALILSFGARGAALTTLLSGQGACAAVAAFVAAAIYARLCGLLPLHLLPPARTDGVAWAVRRPPLSALLAGLAIAATAVLGLSALGGLAPIATAAALATAPAAAWSVCALARRQFGGQTGDVAGAAEQAAEIAMLTAFSAQLFQ
jgi:adenosylcobinamide-GDP ribazoletransferase